MDRRQVWLAVLVGASLAYAVAPESAIAPWIKPLPALSAAALVRLGAHPGRRAVAAGLLVAAAGDVLVEFTATARLGTLAFAVAVLVVAAGLRRTATAPIARGLGLAGAWAAVSGALVVPSLGDRLVAGLLVLAATAAFLVVAGRTSRLTAAGALLIATNFTLFAVDLVVTPLPRWLVIGTYDLGLLLLALDLSRWRTPQR